MSELTQRDVKEMITKINAIFEEYDVSDFQKVGVFEVIKFDMYLSNIKKSLH